MSQSTWSNLIYHVRHCASAVSKLLPVIPLQWIFPHWIVSAMWLLYTQQMALLLHSHWHRFYLSSVFYTVYLTLVTPTRFYNVQNTFRKKGLRTFAWAGGNTFRGIFVNRLLERRYNVPETFWKGCANAPQTVSPNIFTTFQKRYRNRVCERSDGQGVTRFETVLEAFLQNVSKMFWEYFFRFLVYFKKIGIYDPKGSMTVSQILHESEDCF